MDRAQQRIAMLPQLQGALDLAELLHEPMTAYLIERALDEARNKAFSGLPHEQSVRIN